MPCSAPTIPSRATAALADELPVYLRREHREYVRQGVGEVGDHHDERWVVVHPLTEFPVNAVRVVPVVRHEGPRGDALLGDFGYGFKFRVHVSGIFVIYGSS
jgi:hypothetical protein